MALTHYSSSGSILTDFLGCDNFPFYVFLLRRPSFLGVEGPWSISFIEFLYATTFAEELIIIL